MSILIERDPATDQFSRKQLQKITDLPQEMLESLVDKVEFIGANKRFRTVRNGLRMFGLACLLMLKCLVVYCFFKNTDEEAIFFLKEAQKHKSFPVSIESSIDRWITSNQEWLQDYFDDSSIISMRNLNDSKFHEYRGKLTEITKAMNLSDMISEEKNNFIEGKTAELISNVLLSIKKKALCKLSVYFLMTLFAIKVYMSAFFFRNHEANIYKNIVSILSIENETYFCKRGYCWSINENLSVLKLSKIYIRVGKRKSNKKSQASKVKVVLPNSSQSGSETDPHHKTGESKGLFTSAATPPMLYMPAQFPSMAFAQPHPPASLQQPVQPGLNPPVTGPVNQPFNQPGLNNFYGCYFPPTLNIATNYHQANPRFVIDSNHHNMYPHQHHPPNLHDHHHRNEEFQGEDDGEGCTEAFSDSNCDEREPTEGEKLRQPSKHRSYNKSRVKRRVQTYAFTHKSNS